MIEKIVRIASLCVVLAGAETLHGIFRTTILVPKIGKENALKVSIVSGSALAFVVCYFLVPGIGIKEPVGLLATGLVLALFMASFDIILARKLLKLPWPIVMRDFDPRTGNYLSFGLLFLIFIPYAAMLLQ